MAALGAPRRVRVPGDKSISHRALIVGALSEGTTRVAGLLDSDDVRSTAGALRAMGVEIRADGGDTIVHGVGLRGLRTPAVDLDCGNSGTTTRLLAGVVAAHPLRARFVGDASLSRRPMRRVAEPLGAMGARFTFEAGGDHLPMVVEGGALRDIAWESRTASAQVKSAVLLAALCAGVRASVREPALSRDHTERVLAWLGVPIVREGTTVHLEPVDRLAARMLAVPADPSSAAFHLALAALGVGSDVVVEDVCLNPTRVGFAHALRRMGAGVTFERMREDGGEPVGDVHARADELRGVAITAEEVPSLIDELPLLACLGARAVGETVVSGAEELRVKESDRIAAVVANLRAIGADVEERPDGLLVRGSTRPLRGVVATHGDHRLAMAFGVLGAVPGNAITIDDPACVAVSYPRFWEDLADAAN